MKRELCRIVGLPEPSGAFWAIKTPRMADASTADRQDSVQTGWDLSFLDLAGNNLPAQHWNIRAPLPESLQAVGSFETLAERDELIAEWAWQEALKKIDRELGSGPPETAARKALYQLPWTNALWILMATPDELQSWAETLTQRT